MLIRDPGSARVRNAMRDEAVAQILQTRNSTFMDEAADLENAVRYDRIYLFEDQFHGL